MHSSVIQLPGNFNKKVSYRKQIARQHSCRQKNWPGPRAYVVDHVINFRTSGLIAVQNLVAASHAVCAHCRETEKNLERWALVGVSDSLEARFNTVL